MNEPADPSPTNLQTRPPLKQHLEPPPSSAGGANRPSEIGRYRVEKILGEGGFGVVYQAHDSKLDRLVALKVPHPRLVARPGNADAYLTEARNVAQLDHPHIVPVFDVGSTEEYPCFIVSKFIEGTTLASKTQESPLAVTEAAELVATVAEALHYAHRKGLVHRDIKPGNILLDTSGKPFVADFGLALKEEDFGRGATFAGTPSYMSPEQARGEGHRVDGRSDIYSLGVVFYELLTGRRPFRGQTEDELLDEITSVEPRPPRQIDDAIPKELERICLKALSKRASERYTTAKDFADDLWHFIEQLTVEEKQAFRASVPPAATQTPASTLTPSPVPTEASNQSLVKIVPKGLRSFEASDADFFLELLPGPRDRDGLPDSIRFWKTRIEETDPDRTFSVGLLYGPSGCGKSSLMKAGLLPRSADHVLAVYVEAAALETEARLRKALRKCCPELTGDPELIEILAAVRRGKSITGGKKVVIVLDQFEQWLHAKPAEEKSTLVQALRQCDGGRVQCILMVRDDFWLAVSRFMGDLEIELVQGRNMGLVDLFDARHAKRVLGAFGRAFGALPERTDALTREQQAFLDQAIGGLSQDGKIVSVRLALFAEMVKSKPWTPATLRAVGGMEGIGVTFLEETFAAATAPAQHRFHQRAAQAVLKALLPESGSDIKGNMRSHQELLAVSGYAEHPRDFAALLRILDDGLRLVTPTDPEGVEQASGGPQPLSGGRQPPEVWLAQGTDVPRSEYQERFYQLTHDYLVPSLRDWLTRKQKETRKGIAELRLAELSAAWNAKPESRHLPGLREFLSILLFTRRQVWTASQRKMMRKACWDRALRCFLLAACVALVGGATLYVYGTMKAQARRDRLLIANTADVPGIIEDLAPYRYWLNPLLKAAYAQAEKDTDRRKQLHASLALLPVDPSQVEYLVGRLLEADAQEVTVIRGALLSHKAELSERLWSILEDRNVDLDRRFRAAFALASYTPDDLRWTQVSGDVAARLVIQNALVLGTWAEGLQPVGKLLLPPLASFFEDDTRNRSERSVIVNLYRTFAEREPDALPRLEQVLAEQSKADAKVEARVALAKRQANVGAVLVVLGRGEKVWPPLKHSPEPTLRSFLIDRLAPWGVDPKVLWTRFDQEPDVSVKRAILLSLGEFGLDHLPLAERQNAIPRLLQVYRDDPDPGIHGACEWLLRQWQADARLKDIDKELATGKLGGKRKWYINRQDQTMVVIGEPGVFWMGEGAEQHKHEIKRSFAMAAKEVTVEEFQRFRKHDLDPKVAPFTTCPMNNVIWYDAAAYCNWLSEQDGIPKDQWIYEPNEKGAYAEGMKMAANYLQRTGYRLPTEAEWEYACRAGAKTGFAFGEPDELLAKYAWFVGNSNGESRPVAALKPNDLGLFDMHGNAWEWCQDRYREIGNKRDNDRLDSEDYEDINIIKDRDRRVVRGGGAYTQPVHVHSAHRDRYEPTYRDSDFGFRPARTFR